MSDFSDDIRNALRENGISVQIENIWSSQGTEPKVLKRIVNLDFSEHDKMFEDKIKDLEQKIQELTKEKNEFKKKMNNFGFDNLSRQDEIKSLKNRIAELEVELEEKEIEIDIPLSPIEMANNIINATYERETSTLERNFQEKPDFVMENVFTIKDLEQIAEHLLVYCKHNKEVKE